MHKCPVGYKHQPTVSTGAGGSSAANAHHYPGNLSLLDTNAAIGLAFLLGSATALGESSLYRCFFKCIRYAEWITPDRLWGKRWITGIVTSVGDADNFRLYYTPGFGWHGPLKFRHVLTTYRGLRGEAIHIRMAGMDAPEGSHFGRRAQPYAAEALAWLKENVEGQRIMFHLL